MCFWPYTTYMELPTNTPATQGTPLLSSIYNIPIVCSTAFLKTPSPWLRTCLSAADNLRSGTAARGVPFQPPGARSWVTPQGAGKGAFGEAATFSAGIGRDEGGWGHTEPVLTEGWKSRRILTLVVPVGPTLTQTTCYSLRFYPVWGISGIQDTQ